MLRPVGTKPPSVYWRRRVLLLSFVVLLVVLLALTISAVSGTDNTPVGAGGAASSTGPTTSSVATPTKTSSPARSAGKSSTAKSSSPPSRSGSSSVAPVTCTSSDLSVAAVVGKSSYQVGDKPMVELQVTNTTTKPCVQDLADRQVVLKIYNGESRVWGSHDCEVQHGTARHTLAAGAPVRVTITWSGFTSKPGCGGIRQRVGAGTYTLYAELSGKTGRATQFSIG